MNMLASPRQVSSQFGVPDDLLKLHVLITDDHAVVRRGLRQVIAEEFDSLVIAEAATGEDAIGIAREQRFDVVILDLCLPDKQGLDVLKELKAMHRDLPVVVLSIYPEEQFALRAFRAGASAYLTKGSASEELGRVVRKVVDGGQYVSDELAAYLEGTAINGSTALPHETLTNRELEVLCMLGRGQSVTETAEVLSLSVKTVSSHRTRILEKLNLNTTAELIHYVIDHELFPSFRPLVPDATD